VPSIPEPLRAESIGTLRSCCEQLAEGRFEMKSGTRSIYIGLIVVLLVLAGSAPSRAASAGEINAGVNSTLDLLYRQIAGTQAIAARAAGVLVFPTVIKAGMGIGGEYGEGALRVGGKTAAYYNTVSGSVGLQLGAQARSVVIMFMTPEALASFRRVDGWKVGVDGSIAVITVGAGGSVDTNKITNPVIGFILDNKGLMYNLTLEGSKITRISR
jgi:lipid-binding SYLF domain-containing protein